MGTLLAERRRSVRTPAAYQATLYSRQGRVLARGRTTNISQSGAFVVAENRRNIPLSGRICVEIAVPGLSVSPGRRARMRVVRYACRIVRTQALGQLIGLGIEFVRKLD